MVANYRSSPATLEPPFSAPPPPNFVLTFAFNIVNRSDRMKKRNDIFASLPLIYYTEHKMGEA